MELEKYPSTDPVCREAMDLVAARAAEKQIALNYSSKSFLRIMSVT